jgi:hypothetical protein
MSGNKLFVALAITTALCVLSVTSKADNDSAADHQEGGGTVIPCSLVGVNPAYHPEIFRNPVAAREYGFVQSRDGTWQVGAGCGASTFSPAASAYAPRPESQKAIRRHRR